MRRKAARSLGKQFSGEGSFVGGFVVWPSMLVESEMEIEMKRTYDGMHPAGSVSARRQRSDLVVNV